MDDVNSDPYIERVQRSVAMALSHVRNPAINTGFGPWTGFHIIVLIPDSSYVQDQSSDSEPVVYNCYEYYSYGLDYSSGHSKLAWDKVFRSWSSRTTFGFVLEDQGSSITDSVAGFVTSNGVAVACSSSLPELDNGISSRILWWLSTPTFEDLAPDDTGGVEFVK